MLKSLILFTLVLNIAFAKERFTDADKKKFLDDVKQGIAEHKVENKGRVDLQIIKPGLYAELEETVKLEKLTRDEMNKIKQDYESFSKENISSDKAEDAFYSFMEKELNEVSKKPIQKVTEGNICNNWSCEEGLKCAPDPLQFTADYQAKGKKSGVECNESSECASQECALVSANSKKKVCEDVYKCFRPLRVNESCMENPVCGAGQCLPYMSLTSGIGECAATGTTCKKSSDCCSNSCQGGQCKDNYICKDCIKNGAKPTRGQKCCEGLYLNGAGYCVPDVPPSVINEVRVTPARSLFISFVNFFISSADAGEISKIEADFDAMLERNSDAPIGSTFVWGSGTFKVLPTGNLLYTGASGKSVELTEKSNVVKVANASPDLRQSFSEIYGVDPLGLDKEQQNRNANTISSFETIEKSKSPTSSETSTSATIPGFGTVKYTFAHTEGSGEDAVNVPASITSAYGKVYSPASDFYKSNEYAAMVGKKMTAEDYKFLEDEKKAATKTAQSAATDGSAAAALEDEETFLNLGVANDGLDLKSGVNANINNLKNLHTSKKFEELDMRKDLAKIGFAKKSNFATCDMHFKEDFYNGLKTPDSKTGLAIFDLEVAMLGFDFVVTGDADSDYWKNGSIPGFARSTMLGSSQTHDAISARLEEEARKNASQPSSIYNRLKAIGLAHRQVRADSNAQFEIINRKLTCACLDVQGYNKIANDEKKKFFETCDEYAKYKNPDTSTDELNGDASGLKAKRLLVIWTENLRQFYSVLSIKNGTLAKDLADVKNFVGSRTTVDNYDSKQDGVARWNEAEARNYNLFTFAVKNPSGSVAGLGAIVGALLAAGVIAIMGGFATTSILSVWATAGIISLAAVTGAGGMWMIATLKGAWITMKPEISDGIVMPRTYSCGKKESCTDYTRTLVQPYNNICGKHTSANACIKSFIVVNEGKQPVYIIDPWVPAGVPRSAIIRNQPNYVEKLEEGFNAAKNAMILKNPGATGGGGKKGGGNFVSESYLAEVFIDANVVGKYAPAIGGGNNLQENYFLGQDKVKIIKEAARKFAISEGFIEEGDTENLNEFADYAYEYHFLWPKKSRPDEISYPTVGLSTYLMYMAGDVSSNLTGGLTKSVKNIARLEQQYRKDLQDNLEMYDTRLNKVDELKKAVLKTEMDKNAAALASLINFNSLFDSKDLDAQLKSLSNSNSSKGSTLSGSTSGGLSSDQTGVLKAVANLRAQRKAQLKSLDTYNKAIASSGDKDRAAKVASSSKKFSSNFARGFASFSGSNSSLSASGSKNNNSEGDSKKSNNSNSSNLNSNQGISGTGSLYGSGSGSGSSGSGNSASGNTAGAGDSSGAGGAGDADSSKLADAIDARNKSNKDKYQSTEGQSLFEKVTNAYIRNYDKVLTKKKDKDVVEDKQ